jgi:hypothetical protein
MTKNDNKILSCFRDGPAWLVAMTFRYMLGRNSIAVGCFCNDLIKAWPFIDELTQGKIRSELWEAFRKDDVSRMSHTLYRELGNDNSRNEWERVLAAIELPHDK